jgi:hypothetical protein
MLGATSVAKCWRLSRAKRSPNNDLDLVPYSLCKQGVTGSNPVTSTNHLKINHLRQSCFMVSVIFGIWEQ